MPEKVTNGRKLNFSPGPGALPYEVLERAQKELLVYGSTGVSVMEMSHRSKEFEGIVASAQQNLRTILSIPSNYKVLFLQGGGTGQFAAVAMNLLALKPAKCADYVVTGTWSEKAAAEAQKYGKVNFVLPKTKSYAAVPDESQWTLTPDASYVYYCANETIHGVEFHHVPETNGVPLVADMSSNMLSGPVDVAKFGLIYFGAQKNVGPAGVVIVIVREDLLGYALPSTPSIWDYKLQASNNSLYNTPPCFSIYMVGLVFNWILHHGGIQEMNKRADTKAKAIYDVIDESDFYYCPVDKAVRSRMNIPFRVGGPGGNEELEKKFEVEAEERHMIELKGHRSVGGMRASMYNAVDVTHAHALADFMREFRTRYGTSSS